MSSILRITDPIPSDTSIDRYEDVEYEPVAGTNLNNHGRDIRLYIESQDIFTHPSKSYLIIEGSLTNNGVMHLFRNIRYKLSGQEIEKNNVYGSSDYDVRFVKISGRFF